MARSTTPRSGTRRSTGDKPATKAPAKRAAKPEAAASETPVADTVPTPAPAPARRGRPKGSPNKPKAPAKPKAVAKPRAAKAPAATTRGVKAKAAVAGAAAAVVSKLPDVKLPELPEVTPKRAAIGAGLLAGIGAAIFLWRGSRADQRNYSIVEQDGDFEVREYPATTTAAATARGPRVDAGDRNFQLLADYVFARSRPGEKLAMTAPVTQSGSATDGWTTRFLMPPGKARGDLPPASPGVTLESHPPRRVAAVRFSGRWGDDALFSAKEGALRSWLQLKGYPSDAKAEHAAYNSPMMLPPLRRNEVLVTLSEG